MLEQTVAIAEAAGRIVLAHYRRKDLDVQLKADCSPLTAADLESHAFITAELARCSPHPVISEEAPVPYETRRAWPVFWLVDPLDGTKDFVAETDEFTINIALIDGCRPVLGVVGVPALNLIYYAARGQGAFKQSAAGTQKIFNHRSGPALICADSRFHASPHTKLFCEKHGIRQITCFGSALKLCKIAEGEIDVYPRFNPTMEWDTAAGQCIAEEGGGKLVDMVTHAELVYNKESQRNNGFIASRRSLDFA